MYQRSIALLAGLCLCTFLARPQNAAPAFTVDQLVESALARNRDYLSVQQRIREAQGLLKQAGVGIADTIQVSGLSGQALGKAGEDSTSASYSHTFETFGKRARRVEAAEKEVELARAEAGERRRTLTHEVKTQYAATAAEQLKLNVIDRLSKVNQQYLKLTEARVEKGDVARLEADLLQVEVNRELSRRAAQQGRLQAALLQLEAIVDGTRSDHFAILPLLPSPAVARDLDSLKALALKSRPDLQMLLAGVQQREAEAAVAKVTTKPNITVSGQYAHTDTAFDQFGLTATRALTPIRDHADSIGIGISIPVTTARRNAGNIEAAAARITSAKLKREYLSTAIPAQVEAAYDRWKSAQAAAQIYKEDVVAQSEKNLNVMRQAYALGELRLIDVLNEQRQLLDTELSYIDAQADLFRAYADLEEAVGGTL